MKLLYKHRCSQPESAKTQGCVRQLKEASVTHTRHIRTLQAQGYVSVAASFHLSGVLFPQKECNLLVYKGIFCLPWTVNKIQGATRGLALVTQNNLWNQRTCSLFGFGKWSMKTFSPGSTYANISHRNVRSRWGLTRQVHTFRLTIFWSGRCQEMINTLFALRCRPT